MLGDVAPRAEFAVQGEKIENKHFHPGCERGLERSEIYGKAQSAELGNITLDIHVPGHIALAQAEETVPYYAFQALLVSEDQADIGPAKSDLIAIPEFNAETGFWSGLVNGFRNRTKRFFHLSPPR